MVVPGEARAYCKFRRRRFHPGPRHHCSQPFPMMSFRRLGAILRLRCPRCLEGKAFRSLLRLAPDCPTCRFPFEREAGYYVGAFYFGYGLSLAQIAPTMVLLLFLGVPGWLQVAVPVAQLLLLSPLNFRYSRVLWLHFDHVIGLSS